jgi:muramoyltetrapeptide carboxypeptidase
MTQPPALRKGDTIGIFAPSSRTSKTKVKAGVTALEKLGFKIYIHPQTWKRDGSSAGTAKDKAKALHDLFRDKDVKAIICARGGNHAGAMLPLLDYRLIKKNSKILMGYSDVTALLNAIYKETGLVNFHGPMIHGLGSGKPDRKQTEQCFDLLSGKSVPVPMGKAKTLQPGKAEGRLVGGNLSLVCSLMGTKWQPDFRNAIVFLEDCDDALSRYDRMLGHLANAGVFRQAAGVMFGSFTDNRDSGSLPFGFTMAQILRRALGDTKIPAVMNAPFGHGKDLYTFPVGGRARLTAQKGKISLELPGAFVK